MDDLLLDPFELPEADASASLRPAQPRQRRAAVRDVSRPTEHLGIRMFRAEKQKIRAAAKRVKQRPSSWARETLLAAASDEEVPHVGEDALAELVRLRRDLNSGVANNLNQAMRLANEMRKAGESPDEGELARAIREARVALDGVRAVVEGAIRPRGRR